MMNMKKGKTKYYDISHLTKDYPDARYYLVIGERSNGKTYSALNYALERYYKYGEQFAYIRRFGEDVRRKHMTNLLAGHVENHVIETLSKGQYTLVDYKAGEFRGYWYDEDHNKAVYDQQPMGYAFDLNSMEHHKSTSYPKITTIIFDEFMSRQGYLTNEFILFMNMLSTIIRDRENVKIFMLANTVNKFCPYFQEMGLTHVKEQKAGSVDVYTYSDTPLSVVVEYCDPMSKRGGKKSDVYFAFDNPQLKMITSGSWEIAIYPHLTQRYRPKDVVYKFFVLFDEQILHCELVCTDNDFFMFVHPKTTPIKDENEDIVYTNNPVEKWNYKVGIMNQKDKLSLIIQKMLKENRVFYSDNETGEVLRNYLMWAASYVSARGV